MLHAREHAIVRCIVRHIVVVAAALRSSGGGSSIGDFIVVTRLPSAGLAEPIMSLLQLEGNGRFGIWGGLSRCPGLDGRI